MVDLLGWLRSIAAQLPLAKTAERSEVQQIPWGSAWGLLAGVVILYCLGALIGGVLQCIPHPSRPYCPLGAVMLVVINAVMRPAAPPKPLKRLAESCSSDPPYHSLFVGFSSETALVQLEPPGSGP